MNNHLEYLPPDYLEISKCLSEKLEVTEERLANLLNLISLRSSFEADILGEERIDGEFQILLEQLRLECLKEKMQRLVQSVRDAEAEGDEERAIIFLKEFDEVSKLIHN